MILTKVLASLHAELNCRRLKKSQAEENTEREEVRMME
jgi:hypothetical protein